MKIGKACRFLILGAALAGSSAQSVNALGAQPPANRVSMREAQRAAEKVQKGKIESKELEHEHGRWVYSFDIRASDGMIHEVQVDAVSGKIVSRTVETPAQEAAEASAEKGGK